MEERQEMNGTLLSIRNLQAWYTPERPVLSGLSLDLQKHEIVGLIGLNGAGKTTFLNILSGLHSSFQADTVQRLRLDRNCSCWMSRSTDWILKVQNICTG